MLLYIDNICQLSEIIKFICTSFRNRLKSEPFVSFSILFRSVFMNLIFSNNVLILYLSCNVKNPKTTANFVLIGFFSMVLYCYHLLPLLNMNQVLEHLSPVYSKNVSSQCNLTAQIEHVQDIK